MSYRSIKRVLGESSLERKCRFLFGACLLLLITASFWWYGKKTEELIYEQNPLKGRLLANQVMVSLHWKESDTQFADMVEDFTETINDQQNQKYQWDFITSRSIADGKELDKDEQAIVREYVDAALDSSPQTAPPAFRDQVVRYRGEYQYRYYKPIYVGTSSCAVVCHVDDTPLWSPPTGGSQLASGPFLNQGDLMAIEKITIPFPDEDTQKALYRNRAWLVAIAIATMFLAMIAAYVIVRYVIVKPLRHLREVSEAISHGNLALRAEIHTGDEFESLAVAFNRMLRHLVTIQEELRQVNADLDAKVDELAQVNMRLYEMNTIKSDFLSTMSHELRTPLNSILGFSEVLGSIDSLDGQQKRYVQNIQTSGRMLLEMINDILDLAKMESGKMDVRLTDFRVQQIVDAQCDMARPLTERKNIDLEARVQRDLPPMHQDQARVQQILNNLLSNAIKFTPEGGRIAVSARRDDHDRLVMEVSDTGVGIAEEDQQAIFEKFRQGRTGMPGGDATTREYSGTGLGLSIVKELCRLLGGEIAVESDLGRGSTFSVSLPWHLEEQPRLDSVLAEDFGAFTRPRLEIPRDLRPESPDSLPTVTPQPSSESNR
jgi:two-component system sensor histidine kinase BarA